jgi:hypothetical protein
MLVKKHKKSSKIVDKVSKAIPGKKKGMKKKTEKKALQKSIKKDTNIKKVKKSKNIEKKPIQENKVIDVIEKVDAPKDTQINQNPILPMVRSGSLIPFASK